MTKATMPVIPDVESVRKDAIESLIRNLGIGKASFFIRERMSGKTDYVRTKRRLFREKNVDALYARIVRDRNQ